MDGKLDIQSLSKAEQEGLQNGKIPVTFAWLSAMLAWSRIEPGDLRCPALWLVGSNNASAMSSVKVYEAELKASTVQVQIVEGLDHGQEFTEIDRVLPAMLAFNQS